MTAQQRNSSIWFTILTCLIVGVSFLTSSKISQSDMSVLLKAVESTNQVLSGTSEILDTKKAEQSPTQTQKVTSPAASLVTASQSAIVKRIVDGDTFELESGEKVRLIGINTPELHHPQKGVECFGQEASDYTSTLLLGKTVSLEKDVSETDRYGRLLRYVWIDNTLINQKLVADGYAYASSYPPDVKYQEVFKEMQEQARMSKKGLWANCN